MSADGDAIRLPVYILTAKSRDTELTCEFLSREGIDCRRLADVRELIAAFDDHPGVLFLCEQAMADSWGRLNARLAEQPAWSDVPIVLLTLRQTPEKIRSLGLQAGNVTVLERPVRSHTVVAAVKAALRARQRQYEVRHLLARQDELLDRLAEADRRKDEFLALLGHELRNPLNAVQTAIHVMQATTGRPVAPEVLQVLERQTRNLARIVDDLLDVSRVTMGKIRVELGRVDLAEIVRRCQATYAAEAVNRRHELVVTIAPEAFPVHGDQVRLEQILGNLVANAIKYTPPGGRIEVRLTRDGDQAMLTVADNGIGMAPDVLPRIFELFAQASQSLDRTTGGLGLGLSLVRSLVERHGGTIAASSAGLGAGSTFTVRLPIDVQARASARLATPTPQPRAADAGLRVLVIEDNDDARDTLILLLELWGHKAEGAPDGVIGLERMLESPPDVALVDIGLPRLDGYEVARKLRATLEGDQPKLIAMTGYGQPEDRQRALDAGFDVHVAKPVGAEALARVLRG